MPEPSDRSVDDLLAEVALSAMEHDDERLDYVTVQIDRGLWELIQMQRQRAERGSM